jgi:YqaJ-like viral recombinase domain
VKAIQWGTEMESTSLRVFQEHMQLTVQQTGLWLHHTGVLGASPDGLIPDLSATVEVKCPYSAREKTIAEACALNNFFLIMDENGTPSLRQNHPYFDQIQGQMYICGAVKCYFVVYTTKELCVIEINKDDNWECHLTDLVNFYVHYMLPHMIGTAQAEQLNHP